MSIAQSVVSNGDIKNLPKYHRWVGVDNGGKSNEFDSYGQGRGVVQTQTLPESCQNSPKQASKLAT